MSNDHAHPGVTRRHRSRPCPDPASPAAETTDLRDLLERVLVALAPVQIYGLSVSSEESGVVALDGAVRTEQAHQRAESLARQVPGVQRVLNRLVVDPLVGSMPVQRGITEPELATEIELNNLRFAEGTEDDLNTLVGTTDTAIATDETEPYFASTDPVILRAPREHGGYVVAGGFAPSSLDAPIDFEQIPGPLTTGDDEIARRVRLALKEDAGTCDLPIFVIVRQGIVHLRGIVPSLADAELAEEVAARVPGVVDVEEELEVIAR